MSEKQTVADFIAQSDLIKNQISDSMKLVTELKIELGYARDTFEHLKKYSASEVFKTNQPYVFSKDGSHLEQNMPMAALINMQIARINNLLGDKI